MISKDKWVWMPHAAHLIVGSRCRFHLATVVGPYLVSTVGEYMPDSQVREILASSRGITLNGRGDEREADFMKKHGFEEIGCDRKYETMVFRAVKSSHGCCPFEMRDASDLDFEGYNDPADAYKGHLKMCEKWAKTRLKTSTPRKGR